MKYNSNFRQMHPTYRNGVHFALVGCIVPKTLDFTGVLRIKIKLFIAPVRFESLREFRFDEQKLLFVDDPLGFHFLHDRHRGKAFLLCRDWR